MTLFRNWNAILSISIFVVSGAATSAQQNAQGAQDAGAPEVIEAIREPDKPTNLILLQPPKSLEPQLQPTQGSTAIVQNTGGTDVIDFRFLMTPTINYTGGLFDPFLFEVSRSGGGSPSPLQAPPGSAQWRLQQRLFLLSDLKDEIAEYKAARDWAELQDSIQAHRPGWLVIYDQTTRVLPKLPGTEGFSPDNPIPADHITDEPPEEESQILGRTGNTHLEVLEKVIAHDAKKLGLQIDPEGATEQRILDQLTSQIDTESSRVSAAIAHENGPDTASDHANQGIPYSENNPDSVSTSQGPNAAVTTEGAPNSSTTSSVDDQALFEQAHKQIGDQAAQTKQLTEQLGSLTSQIQDAQAKSAALKDQDQHSYATFLDQAHSSTSYAPTQETDTSAFDSVSTSSFAERGGWNLLQDLLSPLSQRAYTNRPKQQYLPQSSQNVSSRKAVSPSDCGYISGYAAGCLQSCMYLACLGGCDGAMVAQCQSDYNKELAWERKAMMECKAGYPIQYPSISAEPTTKSK